MKKKLVMILFLLVISFFNIQNTVLAKAELEPHKYHLFKGKIDNKYQIRMLLYYSKDEEITGNYFYKKYKKKIPLRGYSRGNEVELFELDSKGNKTGKFKGNISELNFQGTWFNLKESEKYNFSLKLSAVFYGDPDNIYAGAGAESTQEVEEFAVELKKDIVNKNKIQVAKKVAYPIEVEIDGKKEQINDKDEFIKKFNKIFYKQYINIVKECSPLNMTASYKGITLGDAGQIWLNYLDLNDDGVFELKVSAINNSRNNLKYYK